MKKQILNVVVKLINRSMKNEVNSACALIGYQPLMPKELKAFIKRKNEK